MNMNMNMSMNIARKISMLLVHRLYRTAVFMALLVVMVVVTSAVNKAQGIDNGPEPPDPVPTPVAIVTVSPPYNSKAYQGTVRTFDVSASCSPTPCNFTLSAGVTPSAGITVSLNHISGTNNLTTTARVNVSATAAATNRELIISMSGFASAAGSARFTVIAQPPAGFVSFDEGTTGGNFVDCVADINGNLSPDCRYSIPVGSAASWSGVWGGPNINGPSIQMIIRGPFRDYTYWYCLPEERELPNGPRNMVPKVFAAQVCETRIAPQIPLEVVMESLGGNPRTVRSLEVRGQAIIRSSLILLSAQESIVIRSGARIISDGFGYTGGSGGTARFFANRDGQCGFSLDLGSNPDDCRRWELGAGPYEPGGGESGGCPGVFCGSSGSGQGGGFGGRGGSGTGNFAGGTGGSLASGYTYGDAWLPAFFRGSGGGGGAGTGWRLGGNGGTGGGAISLDTDNFLLESGATISALGNAGNPGNAGGLLCVCAASAGGGGGSGGSVRINFRNSFSSSGQILARGGSGAPAVYGSCWPCNVYSTPSGGGGGGRVAIMGPVSNPYFDNGTLGGTYTGLGGTISVTGGPLTGSGPQPGGNGTICIGRSPADCGASLFDFTLSNSGNITVPQGRNSSNTITAALLSGTPETVSLSASGLPVDIPFSFTPSSGQPTFSSAFTVNPSPTAAIGTYPVTVTGVSPTVTRTTTFNVIVTVTPTVSPSPPPPSPILNFSANPTSIFRGGSSWLEWTTQNVNDCLGYCVEGDCAEWGPRGGFIGVNKAVPQGSQQVRPRQTSTYGLRCFGAVSAAYDKATVSVAQIKWKEILPRLPMLERFFARVFSF